MTSFDRLFTTMTKPLTLVFYLIFIFLLIYYFDQSIASYFFQLNLKNNLPVLNLITRLGLSYWYFPTFIILALYWRYVRINNQREARAWFLLLCITIPAISCLVLKVIIGRARPNLFFFDKLYGFYGIKWDAYYWSLPSGHTTTIMSVMLGLCILFPHYFYAFLLTAFTVAFTRVLLTYHYLSDVMVAFYLVLIQLGALVYFLRQKSWLAPSWKHEV